MNPRIPAPDAVNSSGPVKVFAVFEDYQAGMKRASAIADRIAPPAMWLVATLHLLFLASVAAIMLSRLV